MALPSNFPSSPHAILRPKIRWLPSKESSYENPLPPLVSELRKEVYEWREKSYEGASDTSKELLTWWFKEEHFLETGKCFQYYFSQRESVETVIYLYDVVQIKSSQDLMRFDSSGAISRQMFRENWRRFVIKMATGSGKTKVISLLLAWSYFHKMYEPDSELARNFLLVAPNIIVLDRLRTDFDGFRIFNTDPIIPRNDYAGKSWENDFQLTVHIQDELRQVKEFGNVFLTNIHRVYSRNDSVPSFEDKDTTSYFLGEKPVAKTTDSKVDLGDIVRDIDELFVINDEAHHIHDEKLAWFKSIEDIHNRLKQKDKFLSLQIDVTATPKHHNGSIFVQTVSDYPLVEAIAQNVVKHPVLPNEESREKLQEKKSAKFTEKYEDYIRLGVIEWRKVYDEHIKLGKEAILFIMTDDTRNCDDVAHYLETTFPYLNKAVLSIHTNKSGGISESTSGKSKEELDELRKEANEIDSDKSRYKAIVSVLVLKEGWDVKNVTTIVGLRAYSSKSNILPEQTLGRGLRLMYRDTRGIEEKVSVIGTEAFINFVKDIQKEGVELEYDDMGERTPPKATTILEIDSENPTKDISKLNMKIPVLTPRTYRDYKDLSLLKPGEFEFKKCQLKKTGEKSKREIHFEYTVTRENEEPYSHTTVLDTTDIIDYRNVLGFFANTIVKELKLISVYDIIYGKVKEFIRDHLFKSPVNLEDKETISNLSNPDITKRIIEVFKKEINSLTVQEKEANLKRDFQLTNTRPFPVKNKGFLTTKSVFNRCVGDNELEHEFGKFLDNCDDIISYTKLYFAIGFKIDYVDKDGNIKNYYPDFLVKKSEKEMFVIETKGREDLNDPLKLARLKQWCGDVNKQGLSVKWGFVFVGEDDFKKYKPTNFQSLMETFTEYK